MLDRNQERVAKDRLGRQAFQTVFTKLIDTFPGEAVIVLDGPWGIGKTHFINEWREIHAGKCIYFDAFQSDYYPEPLIPLCALLRKHFPAVEVAKNILEKSKAVGVAVMKAGLRLGLRASTGGAIDTKELFSESIVKDAQDEIINASTDAIGAYVQESIEKFTANQQSFAEFRELLGSLAKDNGGKLIFIVDELDRCRPSFAVELLEQIKHLFSVPGVVFILVLNQEQLAAAVRNQYGCSDEASWKYLRKFVNLSISLPHIETVGIGASNVARYLEETLNEMEGEQYRLPQFTVPLQFICYSAGAAARDVQQVARLAVVMKATDSWLLKTEEPGSVLACLAFLSVASPQLFALLENMRGEAGPHSALLIDVRARLGLNRAVHEADNDQIRSRVSQQFSVFCESIRLRNPYKWQNNHVSPHELFHIVKCLHQ